jgi:hypothetical protein
MSKRDGQSVHEVAGEALVLGPRAKRVRRSRRVTGLLVGTVTAVSGAGEAVVLLGAGERPARSTVPLEAGHVGREAAVLCEGGDPHRPVVIGLLQPRAAGPAQKGRDVEVNGKRVTLSAKDEITLSCGDSSITLTRCGKVIIKGNYLLSRSAGVNQIKGGSVHIN